MEPFSAVLDRTAGSDYGGNLAGTPPPPAMLPTRAGNWQVKETGKPVALDQQLMLADETNRAFALDNAIVRAFQRMLLASVRVGA